MMSILETLPEANLCLQVGDYQIETLQIADNVIKNMKVRRVATSVDQEDEGEVTA